MLIIEDKSIGGPKHRPVRGTFAVGGSERLMGDEALQGNGTEGRGRGVLVAQRTAYLRLAGV